MKKKFIKYRNIILNTDDVLFVNLTENMFRVQYEMFATLRDNATPVWLDSFPLSEAGYGLAENRLDALLLELNAENA